MEGCENHKIGISTVADNKIQLAPEVCEWDVFSELGKLRRSHYDCEDCWYSCPKSEDGCCNSGKGNECDCGADNYNAIIDRIIINLRGKPIHIKEA